MRQHHYQLQHELLTLKFNAASASASFVCSSKMRSAMALSIPLTCSSSFNNPICKLGFSSRPFHFTKLNNNKNNDFPLFKSPNPSRLCCNFNRKDSDIMSQLELGTPQGKRKPEKRVNGIYWILLLNLGIYVADHVFQVQAIKSLYLYHNWPAWYQFVTSTFCHYSWNHLSSNLFFLYIFGKLVEEEEGNFALWLSYILTGAGANLVSWLVLPSNSVSVGASGAVFGLFAISVLVKMSWDWRKILEVLILGQFVVEKVMDAAQGSTAMAGGFRGGNALQNVNHVAHLSGALIGVLLIWLLSKVPTEPADNDTSKTQKGKD